MVSGIGQRFDHSSSFLEGASPMLSIFDDNDNGASGNATFSLVTQIIIGTA